MSPTSAADVARASEAAIARHLRPVKLAQRAAYYRRRLEAVEGRLNAAWPGSAEDAIPDEDLLELNNLRVRLAVDEAELDHRARCRECGRALRDPDSVARRIGPECYRKDRRAQA